MITSIQVGGITIGGFDTGFLFGKFSGFGFPEVRIDVQNRGNYHGAILGMRKYGRRTMTIEGEIIGSSAADYEAKRRAIEQAVSYGDGLQTVIFNTRGGLAVQGDVIISSALDVPYQAGKIVRGDFRIEFVAPYPFLLGEVENSVEVDLYTGGGGAVPMAIPFSMGEGGSGAATITNDGNGDAYPIIKIYGSTDTPSISNDTVGKSLSISYNLGATEYVEIDMYNRTVLLNGVTNILQYVNGDWWALQPGDNTIKLTASNATINTIAEVIFRDAYLGI